MGSKILSKNYSSHNLFGALKTAFDREHPYNKTIFTVIENDELLNLAISSIQSIVGDLPKKEGLQFQLDMGLAPN